MFAGMLEKELGEPCIDLASFCLNFEMAQINHSQTEDILVEPEDSTFAWQGCQPKNNIPLDDQAKCRTPSCRAVPNSDDLSVSPESDI